MPAFRTIPAFLVATVLSSCMSSPSAFDEARWRETVMSRSIEKFYAPHFKDGEYFNPWLPMENRGFWRFLRWRLSRSAHYTEYERSFKPNVTPHLKRRIEAMPETDFVAWIGHGTFLIRIKGEYWLTDPIFSERAFLPKRVTPPAIRAEAIKEISPEVNILISHNHYDHLDAESIRSLPQRSRIFVPKGLKEYVESLHGGIVKELDWWESIDLGEDKKLVCLPAQHWSRRVGQGFNTTLWASFLLITPEHSIYYGGDSGYFLGFREIGRRFPNIDYALLPVTAYHPRWFMHYAHMNALEAVDAFKDLGAKYFIPTQWGTFHLGDNPPGYPVLDLMKGIEEMTLDASRFIIMDIGQIRGLSKEGR